MDTVKRTRSKSEGTMPVTPLDAAPNFKYGCDPEVFIVDRGGHPVPAEGIIPGTKEKPHPVEHGAVQVDGMAAEFNTDPAANFADFNRNIAAVMGQLEGYLPKGHKLAIVPSIEFPKAVFDAAPETSKELGCQPDYNAWTNEANPPPLDLEHPYLRTASGHLHVGWGDGYELSDVQHILNCQDLVKQFDWFLGAYSVSQDPDPSRRRLYGKAGAYRPKSYGVEYRVLSNFWITTKERRLAVWNRMQMAISEMRNRFIPNKVRESQNRMIVDYINRTKRDRDIESLYRFPIMTTDISYARM